MPQHKIRQSFLKGSPPELEPFAATYTRHPSRLRRGLMLAVCLAGLLLAALLAVKIQGGGVPLGQAGAAAAGPGEAESSTGQVPGQALTGEPGGAEIEAGAVETTATEWAQAAAPTAPESGADQAAEAADPPPSAPPAGGEEESGAGDGGSAEESAAGDVFTDDAGADSGAEDSSASEGSAVDGSASEGGDEAGIAEEGGETTSLETAPGTETTAQSPAAGEAASPASAPGRLYLALVEFGYAHMFVYQPQSLPLTRITGGPWDDITPAASPDGAHLAFASNRGGFWDLYCLDLASGETTQLTHTPEYEAAPSWSPDGRWLAYEAYTGPESGLDIFLLPLSAEGEPEGEPVRLTDDPAADHSPAWSPGGRQIAFVSTRGGGADIWLADLDRVEGRFQNLSRNSRAADAHPAWSPDGSRLAWSSAEGGFPVLKVLDLAGASGPASLGSGAWPAWSPDGAAIITSLEGPNQTYLTGYSAAGLPAAGEADTGFPAAGAGLALPPVALAGELEGLSWSASPVTQLPPQTTALDAAAAQPSASGPGATTGRQRLVDLPGVEAPFALLQDRVDEAFTGLRAHLADRTGWDFLASLENAYVPLTTPAYPGMAQDWLYTGRAFAFNTAPLQAGWLVVVREDFGPETYWRVYLRARFQDGSQGRPLHDLPWDFDARSSGDPQAYEQGGAPAASIPGGYWLDFTQAARSFGWERLAALTMWRAAYPTARFNQFVRTDGLDWEAAMEEIYPSEALAGP